jgi:hypothetical protein
LALAVLAMPASALVSCWAPAGMSAACPLCPLMSRHAAPLMVQTAPAGMPCCNVSSAKPTPASVPAIPTTTALLAPPAATLVTMVVAVPRHSDAGQHSALPPVSPQAVLCTFLI